VEEIELEPRGGEEEIALVARGIDGFQHFRAFRAFRATNVMAGS
jgi:hypothetical protein